MNTLSFDIGNTGIKVDAWTDQGFLRRESDLDISLPQLLDLIESLKIKAVVASSVRKEEVPVLRQLKENSDVDVIYLNNEEIRKYYDLSKYSGNIGADRFAAYLGARKLYGAKAGMIVDLGTAMTLDVIDSNGTFAGGNISLGLFTRLKALATSTSLLPEIGRLQNVRNFGGDTASAMESGAFNGVIGEIEYSLAKAKEDYGIEYVVFTGGDAEIVYPVVSTDIIKHYDPYLVGRGLDYHLRTRYVASQD